MKKLYSKTFDYYNADETINARLVFSIDLDKNIIRETASLHKITESPESNDKVEHFEKMYSKNEWEHNFTKEIFLGITSESCDFYFEKYALNFGDGIIRRSILKIIKPEYKYIIRHISIEQFSQGLYCDKEVSGDNDVLYFNNALGKISFDSIKEKNNKLIFIDDKLSFIMTHNNYNILFEMCYLTDTENKSTPRMIHPSDIYYEIYITSKQDARQRYLIGSTLQAGTYLNLIINDPDKFYDDFKNHLDHYSSILNTPLNRNPLFSSNFKKKNESDIMKNPASIFDITSKNISFNSYYIDPGDSRFAVRRPTSISLPFTDIVDMFTLDDDNVLQINYANRHIQYIVDTFPDDCVLKTIRVMKEKLKDWRLKNSYSLYAGCGI